MTAEWRAVAEFVLGSLAFGHGDPATSMPILRGARRSHRQMGDELRAAADSILLGIAVGVSDPASGERLERGAVAVLRRHGEPWKLAFALYALGQVLFTTGRTEEAVHELEESIELQRHGQPEASPGPHPLLSYAMVDLGWAQLALEDAAGGGVSFRRALAAAGEADQQVRARALEGLAAVALHEGRPRTGGMLFGGAEAVRRSIGLGVWLTDQATHAATEANLRSSLGPSAYDAAFQEGLRCPLDDLCGGGSAVTAATTATRRRVEELPARRGPAPTSA
jgi:hypothetical protein